MKSHENCELLKLTDIECKLEANERNYEQILISTNLGIQISTRNIDKFEYIVKAII